MVEVAQSPKTGEITVKRHGFGENHRKNTPKTAPNRQISKCPKTFFRDCVKIIKKSRSRAIFYDQLRLSFFSNQPKRLCSTTRARS
jgi:hypothetical protein